MAKCFRDLKVWRAAMDVAAATYELTAGFPREEQFGLKSQMRRCAVSIASNIAEGSGRESRRDFRQFVLIARGSTCELQTQLIMSVRLEYCTQSEGDKVMRQVDEVGRMLNGLATFLRLKSESASNTGHWPLATGHWPLATGH